MNIHQNAKLTPKSRADVVRRILDQGQTPKAVASAFGVCARTVRKWVARYRAEGADGLLDRSSRPHRSPRTIPAAVINRITTLRRLRWTGAQIAATPAPAPAGNTFMSASTTTPASPSPSSIPTRPPPLPRPFSPPPSTTTTASASASAACSLTTAGVTVPGPSMHAVSNAAYAIASPGPSPLVPTAKPNASSRPRYVSGPTPTPITPPPSVPNTSNTGSTATIGTAHTLVLKPTRPSVESV